MSELYDQEAEGAWLSAVVAAVTLYELAEDLCADSTIPALLRLFPEAEGGTR